MYKKGFLRQDLLFDFLALSLLLGRFYSPCAQKIVRLPDTPVLYLIGEFNYPVLEHCHQWTIFGSTERLVARPSGGQHLFQWVAFLFKHFTNLFIFTISHLIFFLVTVTSISWKVSGNLKLKVFMFVYTVFDNSVHKLYICKSDVWLTVHRNSVWIRKTN